MNVLPADVMAEFGAKKIIAVDVAMPMMAVEVCIMLIQLRANPLGIDLVIMLLFMAIFPWFHASVRFCVTLLIAVHDFRSFTRIFAKDLLINLAISTCFATLCLVTPFSFTCVSILVSI